ncbi:MAG: DUF2017 domain-containing protein [Bifidobacteriaceae bacterium]|jgi:hypothetical protein|nr:DUF2017 domain-containing protein [Bifidobacteriaceae bacterium]
MRAVRLFSYDDGYFVATLSPEERAVLASIAGEVQGMVRGEAPPSLDVLPSLKRLFPPASMDDGDIARDFASLTGRSLRETKDRRLGRLAERLARGAIRLDHTEAGETVAALNDLRLAIAEILRIETADDAEQVYATLADRDEPVGERDVFGEVYVALSVLQESLVAALEAAAAHGRTG